METVGKSGDFFVLTYGTGSICSKSSRNGHKSVCDGGISGAGDGIGSRKLQSTSISKASHGSP